MKVLRIRVLLAGVVLGAVPVAGGLAGSSAQALSCVAPESVVANAERVFTARVVARQGDEQITLQVVENRTGTPLPATLDLALEAWGFDPPSQWPTVSQEQWLVALAPGAEAVSPCVMWRLDTLDPQPTDVADGALTPQPTIEGGSSSDHAGGQEAGQTPASGMPVEAWNAEHNPDMARLAQQHAADPAHEELTGPVKGFAALGGVALGLGVLGAVRMRRRP